MQQIVTEEYYSTQAQQIAGVVYGPNEVVPGAASLLALPALIRTNRLRAKTVVQIMDETATDLGSAQAAPKPKPKPKGKK